MRKNKNANKEMKGKEEEHKDKNVLDNNLKKSLEINNEEGLKLSYSQSDMEARFPQLMHELSIKKKSFKIEGVDYDLEQEKAEIKKHPNEPYFEDFNNPGVIDFLRRCTGTEDALKILDYLLERNELKIQDYQRLKNRLKEIGGLKELILEYGGLKTPGYYERKFPRKKNLTDSE